MKRYELMKVIASLLIAVSALTLNPIKANAEWVQDSNGWWNTEGDSYSVGWKQIDEKWYYFDKKGYMRTGWLLDEGKWYYLNSDGTMAKNTTIDKCYLNSDGVWTQNNVATQDETNVDGVTIKLEKSSYKLGTDQVKFCIKNNTDKYIMVEEEDCLLERFENQKWCIVNRNDIDDNDSKHMNEHDSGNKDDYAIYNGPAEGVGFFLSPQSEKDDEFISLNGYKGNLKPGKYRIVQKIIKLNASNSDELLSNGDYGLEAIKNFNVAAEFELQ